MTMRRLILAVAFAVTASAAAADPFDDAAAARKRQDYAGAERILLPLAERGDLRAQVSIANFYEGWWFIPKRYAESATWYRRAAEQGSAEAQHRLGDMYLRRQGVPFDPSQAAAWYRRAADQGYRYAQYALSRMYADGWGVPKDNVSAYMWLSVAISSGYWGGARNRPSGGRGELGALARSMTAAQLAEARKLAGEWKRQPAR